MYEQHRAFLEWAAGYDTGEFGGRSRLRHEVWLAQVPQPILRISGLISIEEQARVILTA